MLSPRWRKVLRDLWGNKTRTVLVVLSIAVGVFAVGMIASSRVVLSREMTKSYLATNPASAILYTEPFDDDLVETVRGMKEVSEAEGRRSITVRFQVGPDDWRNLELSAIPDYDDIQLDKVWPVRGAWPPPERGVLIERTSLDFMRANVGDRVLVETPDGKQRQLHIAGLVHDISRLSPAIQGIACGYITFDTLEWLGVPRNFDELHIVVAENALDEEHVRRIGNRVQDKVEKSGRTVGFTWVPTPGKHPIDDIVQAIVLVLGVLGLLSLLLSGFLVVNTIWALLTQQIRQVGIMKAVGARSRQIMGLYLGMVLIFGLLALVIAVPLGMLGTRAFTNYLATFLNFDIASFSTPPQVLALQVAVGLVVPLLAALYPVVSGVRITVREAISTYGLGKGRFGTGVVDRLLGRVRGLSRPLLLSLRNTFRRKGRLALTLTTLTLGGAMFIAVFSVRASTFRTINDALEYWRYDAEVSFGRAYRIERIEREALSVPGVVAVESWGFANARRLRPDDSESENIIMIAPPAQTDMIQPVVLEGRWLLPEDENALVINHDLLRDDPDVEVGDEIVLKIDGRETTWQVVGLVKGILTSIPPIPFVYANYPYFARVVRDVGRAGSVQVVTAQHDANFQSEVAKALEEHFKRAGLRVSATFTTAERRTALETAFNPIVILLFVMAVLLAVVGGLGLMGTMSLNVLERTREIGVMRAVGASDGAVRRVFIVEGIFIGVLSWLLGTGLALSLSKLLSDAVGLAFTKTPLSYTFSVGGVLIWLVVVVILAALASFLPARSASRLTVREVLAYE